jgi:hypothetical protein
MTAMGDETLTHAQQALNDVRFRVKFEYLAFQQAAWVVLKDLAADVVKLESKLSSSGDYQLTGPMMQVLSQAADTVKSVSTSAVTTFQDTSNRLEQILGAYIDNSIDNAALLRTGQPTSPPAGAQ